MPEPIDAKDRAWRGHLLLVACATLATGALWLTIVPPFEGTDELYFYNRTRQAAAAPERRENVFFRLAAPIVRAMSPTAAPAAPEYNPAFRFVSNEHGEVNRFVHDRPVAPRDHVRTLMAMRALVALLAVPAVLIVYATARLATGSGATALLATGVALAVPQFTFINAVVHPEAITRLFAAAVTLLIVARAVGAIPRWLGWTLLPMTIAAVPFADRQALFVAPFAVVGLVATERTLRSRAVAAATVMIPAAIAVWIVMNRTEAGTDLGRWVALLRHPIQPLVASDPTRGSVPPTLAYYTFEFLPKMFMGFWGWLGQPSILLPAWMYGALAALTIVAAAGLAARLARSPAGEDERRRLLARRLMGVGIALMWVPILYGPALMGLNLWYGRWLFPMIGPIAIGLVLGVAEFAQIARAQPQRVARVLGAVVAGMALAWLTGPGAAARAAIEANHYGDRARLIATASDTLIALALVAAAVAAVRFVRFARVDRAAAPTAAFIAVVSANVVFLVAFVRPLYAPMSADDYAALITKYVAAGETTRAANLYASAVKSYPQSRVIRTLADSTPRLLLGGESAGSRAIFWQWIARGRRLTDRDSLLMLAHEASADPAQVPPAAADAMRTIIADAAREADLEEPAALLRLALDGGIDRGDPSALPIEAGRGRRFEGGTPIRNGEIVLDGFTVHPRAAGGTQLIVYFRPRDEAANRRVWIHAYPGGSPPFLDLPAAIPPVWKPRALAWAAYDLPPGRFGVYLGLWVGNDIGDATLLGAIP